MSTNLLIAIIVWFAISFAVTVLVFKAKNTKLQKIMLLIAIWCIPFIGCAIVLFTLLGSNKRPWNNPDISGTPDAMEAPHDGGE